MKRTKMLLECSAGHKYTQAVPTDPDVFCEQAYKQETGKEPYYAVESWNSPGRNNYHVADAYVEWLEERAAKFLQSN